MPAKGPKEGGTKKAAKQAYGKKIVKLSKAYAVGQKIGRQRNKGMVIPTKKLWNKYETYLGMSKSDYFGLKPVQRKMYKAANSGYNSVLKKGDRSLSQPGKYGYDKYGNKIYESKNVLGKYRQPKVAAMARINAVLPAKKKSTAKKTTPKKGKK